MKSTDTRCTDNANVWLIARFSQREFIHSLVTPSSTNHLTHYVYYFWDDLH